MSNIVIEDLVLPVVLRILEKQHGINTPTYAQVKDERLINFFHEELSKNFSICGGMNECDELRRAIEEAMQLNEQEFIEYIKLLLNRYIHLRVGVAQIQKLKPKQIIKLLTEGKTEQGPPSKFDMKGKKYPSRFDKWTRKEEQ